MLRTCSHSLPDVAKHYRNCKANLFLGPVVEQMGRLAPGTVLSSQTHAVALGTPPAMWRGMRQT